MTALVTLTSDFGTRDPYAGAMRGVLLSLAPGLTVVDIGHEVPPQDVLAGAFLLRHAAFEFPAGTVHLAVVDPGVGGPRRPLAVDAGGYRWVGPDNGLLSFALACPGARVYQIRHPDLRRDRLSATFHGRDLFAPAAARLAQGFPLDRVGPPVDDPVRLPEIACARQPGRLVGAVLHVDRFGNLITCIAEADLASVGPRPRVRADGVTLEGLVTTYGDVARGALAALVGSSGLLEIAANGGSAAALLGLGRGAQIVVEGT